VAFSTEPAATFSTRAASSAPLASFTPVNSTRQQASIPKQQKDVTLKAHVANICFKCFKGMLQVFYIEVATRCE
jgi:hypothetical protein